MVKLFNAIKTAQHSSKVAETDGFVKKGKFGIMGMNADLYDIDKAAEITKSTFLEMIKDKASVSSTKVIPIHNIPS